jgi:hypothetical protein
MKCHEDHYYYHHHHYSTTATTTTTTTTTSITTTTTTTIIMIRLMNIHMSAYGVLSIMIRESFFKNISFASFRRSLLREREQPSASRE